MLASTKCLPKKFYTVTFSVTFCYLLWLSMLLLVTHNNLLKPDYILLNLTNVFISNRKDEIEHTFRKFSGFPRLVGIPIEEDLSSLEN